MELWSQSYNAPQISPNFGTSYLWNPTPRTEASSFSRYQNIFCWSKLFVPDKKIISISYRYKKCWSGTKCNSIFGNDQKIWDNTKYFGTSRRTGHEPSFQPGVLSASDALQKIQTRRKRPRIRVRNNKRRPASRISAQAGQHAVGLLCLRNTTKSLKRNI